MGDENPPTPSTSSAARKKEEKARKKDQRSWENVMKSMGDMPEAERIGVIQQRYTSLYNDLRHTAVNYQSLEKKFITLQKERDQARTELNKNILAKAKLESLCRELQKQNKAIKDENITRVKEEEEKRREVATNFTERLNSLSSMMDENKDKSVRLREENMNMTLKLTELYNKFQERESHLADVNRQLDAQKELFEFKIKKMELEYKADRKAWEEESKALLSNLLKSNETNRLLEENIKSMQANLDVYKNQYSDFEQTMSRSNEVFKTFHGEINKLQKSNTTLEKERGEYIAKWQSCHNSVVEISEKNQQLAKKLEMSEKKVATLEKLCRQLQAERTNLHKQLQDKIESIDTSQKIEEKNITNADSSRSALQESAPKKVQSKDKPKESLNGDVKSTNRLRGEEYDENEELISMPSDDEAYQQEAWQEQIIQLLDPCAVDPELLTAENNDPHVMDFSDVEMDAAGDGTIPQLEAHYSVPIADTDSDTSGENLDDTVINLEQPSSSSEILVKEVRSVPITKKDHEAIDENNFEELQSSTGDLHGDLSMETLPLYKPIAVTDVPTQGGHVTLVKESEARTNILDPTTEEESEEQSVPSEDTESSATIHLKESEGKTEFSQE
ncbi:alpha-taxilin [Anoplophora glabripennis]|uniref:alpha-taxilin n=1 Tax=Anoplophora glabripennis TaxID=217634 RepID=UPI0008743ADE|nr:alpha-taxilin [Anoplophora glabripennis]XP_018565024.1 alpha-taxilin [Anoplophora glabripennis]XP_018565025.1 alpha-taxilin [Anoplophora glabripennis]